LLPNLLIANNAVNTNATLLIKRLQKKMVQNVQPLQPNNLPLVRPPADAGLLSSKRSNRLRIGRSAGRTAFCTAPVVSMAPMWIAKEVGFFKKQRKKF
jgi:hypothetical protein